MGARITGVGTNLLQVEGVEKLHGGEITIAADHVNAASFLALAAATGGNIDLYGEIVTHDYWMTRRIFERLDARFEMEPGHISMHRDGRPLKVVREFDGQIPTISDGPWPQFPSDMMSCLIAAATQAEGSVLFFEKIFDEVRSMSHETAAFAEETRMKVRLLDEYYTSGEWQEDYEADEEGLLAADLKRGVLSQDGLYDFLKEWQAEDGR
jgi:UDP-N-acetylglucosamine enolpyruvyl transferase